MAEDAMRAKARQMFGKGFMDAAKPQPPAKNSAVASQKVANQRPIPTYKVGGVVSNKAVDEARVAARAKAAGYKDGGAPKGVKKKAEGGAVDRDKDRLDRKIADIEKDFRKSIAGGKDKDVAEAKKAQRMADARDDYAKWTGGDRTATRAAERSAERELTMTRRYGAKKSVAPTAADEPLVRVSPAEVMAAMPTPKAPPAPAAPKRAPAPATRTRAATPERAPSRPTVTRPAPAAAAARPAPARTAPARTAARPAARADTSAGDRATALERDAARIRVLQDTPGSAEGRRARLASMFGAPGSAEFQEGAARGVRTRAMLEAKAQAERDAYAYSRRQKLADLKAAAEAPGASRLAKDRYRYASETGMYAAGGAAKVRKGQAK